MADESRAPFALDGYTIGVEGKPHHFVASTTREDAAQEASSLREGDAAFIKRSDLKWTYAIVTERTVVNGAATLRFEVDAAKNRKSFPENQWGKYIRVINVNASETEPVEVLTPVTMIANPVTVTSAPAAIVAADEKSVHSVDRSVKSAQASVRSARATMKSAVASVKSVMSSKIKSDKADKVETVSVIEEERGDESVMKEQTIEEPRRDEPNTEELKTEVIQTEEEPKVEATSRVDHGADADKKVNEKSEKDVETDSGAKVETKSTAVDTKPSGGWLSSLFGSVKSSEAVTSTPGKDPAPAAVTTPAPAVVTAAAPAPVTAPGVSSVVNDTNPKSKPESYEEKSSKENNPAASEQLTSPTVFLPTSSPLSETLPKRNPASILKFKFGNKKPLSPNSTPLNVNTSFHTSPMMGMSFASAPNQTPSVSSPKGKEWFDPEASERDYDKDPTDLFQALEAREFEYAFEMYEQTNENFTKDCKTWVVAKGLKKDQQLRFRALPLHAAIVFDAPDELIIKILRAYPKATRGRDVKGRLPIHLAFEHQTSDQVLALLVDAFPKGFFAKDKKEMIPLDHINGNTTRAYLAKYIPQVVAAKIEEEREKWVVETNMLLEHQKGNLQNDEEFMAEVIQHVQEEVDAHNMSKLELLEANYKKEIELLKKKHDSETQALLEGFEVKLNFERKLCRLKTPRQ